MKSVSRDGGIKSYHYVNEKTTFLGREDAMAELQSMADAPEPFCWKLLCGSGGAGKSRLALQFITSLERRGWQARFLDLSKTPFAVWETWRPKRPCFFVLDYVGECYSRAKGAESGNGSGAENFDFPAIIRLLADRAADKGLAHRVRFLLIEREYKQKEKRVEKGPGGELETYDLERPVEWYAELLENTRTEGSRTRGSCHKLDSGPLELRALSDDELLRLAEEVNRQQSGRGLPDAFIQELEKLDKKKRALFAILLAAYLAENDAAPTRENVLEYALKLEADKSWKPCKFTGEDYEAMVTATVTRGPQTLAAWEGDKAKQTDMVSFGLGYVDDDSNRFYLNPLEPDLLGEFFVLERDGSEGMSKRLSLNGLQTIVGQCWDKAPQMTGIFFDRCRQDFFSHPALFTLIKTPPAQQAAREEWARVVTGYVRKGDENDIDKGLELLNVVRGAGDTPTLRLEQAKITTALILDYSRSKKMKEAEDLFASFPEHSGNSEEIDSEEMNFYKVSAHVHIMFGHATNGNIKDTRRLYDSMPETSNSEALLPLTARAKASMILAFSRNGDAASAHRMFDSMAGLSDLEGIRFQKAWAASILVQCYAARKDAPSARKMYNTVLGLGDFKKFRDIKALATGFLISCYAENKDISSAQEIYDAMFGLGNPEEFFFQKAYAKSFLLKYYAETGDIASARKLYDDMAELKDSEEVRYQRAWVTSYLIDCYAKIGDTSSAYEVYTAVPLLKDLERYHLQKARAAYSLVECYADNGDIPSAHKVYADMAELGDSKAISSQRARAAGYLVACYAEAEDLPSAQKIYTGMSMLGDTVALLDMRAATSALLISVYGHKKDLESARNLFDEMKSLRLSDDINKFRIEAGELLARLHTEAGDAKAAEEILAAVEQMKRDGTGGDASS